MRTALCSEQDSNSKIYISDFYREVSNCSECVVNRTNGIVYERKRRQYGDFSNVLLIRNHSMPHRERVLTKIALLTFIYCQIHF